MLSALVALCFSSSIGSTKLMEFPGRPYFFGGKKE